MVFQIKYIKEYLRQETGKILRIIDNYDFAIETLGKELLFIEKCRGEINQANKLIRENKKNEK